MFLYGGKSKGWKKKPGQKMRDKNNADVADPDAETKRN